MDPHSDLLLACGFLPYQRPRGLCEVRGRLANLWYAAAKALGFNVTSIWCPDLLFLGSIKGLGVRAKSLVLLLQGLQRPHSLPDVVFLSVASIPLGSNAVKYWGTWMTPHLFYCFGSDNSMLWGARCTIPWGKWLSRRPLGGWRGWFASRTMRRGEPRREGGLLQSGIRLTSCYISSLEAT